MMERMADEGARYHLALSLHAANDKKRDKIMSINEQNNLERLKRALVYYYDKTKESVTFEYIMLRNFNDSLTDAKELAAFCQHVPSKVNLIEYNPIDEADFQRSDEKVTEAFMEELRRQGVTVNLRRSRGKDIDAACGQLANKNETKRRLTTAE
jgi:23S rRNA (adenine2503-C2)-methyltransferase